MGSASKAASNVGNVVKKTFSGDAGGMVGEIGRTLGPIGEQVFGGDLAEKAGLGKYKPGEVNIDESAFTDTTKSDARIKDLKEKQLAAEGRTPEQVTGSKIGASQDMTAAKLAAAETIQGKTLGTEHEQLRDKQIALANALEQQAAGQGPSLAGTQLNEARNQQIQTAMALAASQRGQTAGQGLRGIADQTANANQFAAAEAAKMRIAEQLAARDQLAGVTQGARGQDINVAGANAQLGQQANLANQQAQNQNILQQGAMDQQANVANQAAFNQNAIQQAFLNQKANMANQQAGVQQTALNDQFVNSLGQQLSGLTMGQQGNLQALEKMKLMAQLEQEGLEAGAYKDHAGRMTGFLGGLGEGLVGGAAGASEGGAGMFSGMSGALSGTGAAAAPAVATSDINAKTNIKTGDKEIKKFLGALGSHSYDYKDEKHGKGRYLSPMAQELEKSELGRDMVFKAPDGTKMVNYARGAGTFLAAAAMLNKRLDKLESGKKRRR